MSSCCEDNSPKKEASRRSGSGCCGSPTPENAGIGKTEAGEKSQGFETGSVSTAVGEIPIVSAGLTAKDRLTGWKIRWGIERMTSQVRPGLYGLGSPTSQSPVLVTANFRLTLDALRKELGGQNAWILVLDTKGINVWCAAGKGTFGTDEVVNRVQAVNLAGVVSHRTLILPQLGAPGVAAHEVKKRSGFRVIYGPVKASDIPAFLRNGMAASPGMRDVTFTWRERLILTPVELTGILRHPIALALIAFYGLKMAGLKWIPLDGPGILGAILAGTVLVPLFLPWIPGKAFAFKGWLLGLVWALALSAARGALDTTASGWTPALVNVLIFPAISAFLAMNYTGSSTYTSLSGVVREMKYAVPAMIVSASLGLIMMMTSLIIRF